MVELSRAEKMRRTRIENIRKEFGGISERQADKIRIKRLSAQGSKGGRNGKGYGFGHGKVDPKKAGEKGRQSRWKNESA